MFINLMREVGAWERRLDPLASLSRRAARLLCMRRRQRLDEAGDDPSFVGKVTLPPAFSRFFKPRQGEIPLSMPSLDEAAPPG